MIDDNKKRKKGKARTGSSRDAVPRLFSILFMAFFSWFFGSLSGPCPIPRRKGEPPALPREGRLRRKPISTPDSRANFHHEGQRPFQEGMVTTNSKKEGQEGTANHTTVEKKTNFGKEVPTHHLEKAGPTRTRKGQPSHRRRNNLQEGRPTPKRQDQFPPEEWQANPNPEKEGPTTHLEKEGPNTTLPKRESQRNAPRRGQLSRRPANLPHPRPHCLGISCVTPDLNIENLKLALDQKTPQNENANVATQIAIEIAIATTIAIAIKLQLQFELHLRLRFLFVV